MNILIFGTSITWGAWDTEGGWAQRLKNYCDNKAIESRFEEYTTVYCLGVSGDKTSDLLARFEEEVRARIEEDEKTLVLVEIGINDSQFILEENKHEISPEDYRYNLLKLVDESKQLGVDLCFVSLTPVDDDKVDPTPWTPGKSYRLTFVKQYEDVLRTVANEQHIHLINIIDKFIESDYKSLLEDGLHPNSAGHQLIYETVKEYLSDKRLL